MSGRQLYLHNDIKEHLKWPPKEYVKVNFPGAKPHIVYVTGANDRYYKYISFSTLFEKLYW